MNDSREFVSGQIAEIRGTVGDGRVLCALSGGVDSSVAAVLTQQAVGERLTCVFVDHGLLRKGEADQVMEVYGRRLNIDVRRVDAADRFLDKLAGVTDPEQKRKIIGAEFIAVFEEEAKRIGAEKGGFDFLLQGTIYPDIVESGKDGAQIVKSHHNVGGLPETMGLKLLEPLRTLYKNEVRMVGEALGLAPELVWRQPFPGPGLAVRCLGEVNREKLGILREADAIVRAEIDRYNEEVFAKTGQRVFTRSAPGEGGGDSEDVSVWQYFAILPNLRSVGVKGGARTYEHAIAIRAVHSTDGMTSDWARLPYGVLENISGKILAEVGGVNRVVYDVSTKPPATVEWE